MKMKEGGTLIRKFCNIEIIFNTDNNFPHVFFFFFFQKRLLWQFETLSHFLNFSSNFTKEILKLGFSFMWCQAQTR